MNLKIALKTMKNAFKVKFVNRCKICKMQAALK